jgi:hypothetical protein
MNNMPNRILRDWTDSDSIDTLSPESERFFVRLIMKADDHGRYFADLKRLKAFLFPLKESIRETDISRWLAECEKAGLIRFYDATGKRYLEIKSFNQRLRQMREIHPRPQDVSDSRAVGSNPPLEGNPNQKGNEVEHAREDFPEIQTLEQAFAQTVNVAIPQDFCKYVFDDWSSRGGKDGGGNVIAWLAYVTKRWTREQVEWKNGKHKGNKSNETDTRTNPRHRNFGITQDLAEQGAKTAALIKRRNEANNQATP